MDQPSSGAIASSDGEGARGRPRVVIIGGGFGGVAGGERLEAATVLWTASPLSALVGAPTDRAGRAVVGPGLETTSGSGIFVIGDAANVTQDGKPAPGVAQAALQQGAYVASRLSAEPSWKA